jgi:hypothetical protein
VISPSVTVIAAGFEVIPAACARQSRGTPKVSIIAKIRNIGFIQITLSINRSNAASARHSSIKHKITIPTPHLLAIIPAVTQSRPAREQKALCTML